MVTSSGQSNGGESVLLPAVDVKAAMWTATDAAGLADCYPFADWIVCPLDGVHFGSKPLYLQLWLSLSSTTVSTAGATYISTHVLGDYLHPQAKAIPMLWREGVYPFCSHKHMVPSDLCLLCSWLLLGVLGCIAPGSSLLQILSPLWHRSLPLCLLVAALLVVSGGLCLCCLDAPLVPPFGPQNPRIPRLQGATKFAQGKGGGIETCFSQI